MRTAKVCRVLVSLCLCVLSSSCGPREDTFGLRQQRYRLNVLSRDIDPQIIPGRFDADLDGDGAIDRVSVTDTSVTVVLTGGDRFSYVVGDLAGDGPGFAVGEFAGDSGMIIDDARLFSFRRDGAYPSIVLATRRQGVGYWGAPAMQLVVVNDRGTLTLKRVWRYPAAAVSVDCTWLEANDLPACFYATYRSRELPWGSSGLYEIDVHAWSRYVADSAERARDSIRWWERNERLRRMTTDRSFLQRARSRGRPGSTTPTAWDIAEQWMDLDLFQRLVELAELRAAATPGDTAAAVLAAFLEHVGPRERVRLAWGMERSELDSILAAGGVRDEASLPELDLTLRAGVFRDYGWVYARDLTATYRLPLPHDDLLSYAGDGRFLMGVEFFDFTGDGLDDLVAVGEHSRILTAVQNARGHFEAVQYHSFADDYMAVWAPNVTKGSAVDVPPCVYVVLERSQAHRSADFVECYDGSAREWYELALPGGSYFMDTVTDQSEYRGIATLSQQYYVPFWDLNGDGTIDFAVRGEDGSWTAFTFVRGYEPGGGGETRAR